MKLAILANDRNSFVKPMAEGLARMSKSCGADADVLYDGLSILSAPVEIDFSSVGRALRSSARWNRNRRWLEDLVAKIADCDAIVVVANVPISFVRGFFPNIEVLRRRLPETPIVNYDLHYLPTLDKWGRAMLRGERVDLSPSDAAYLGRGSHRMDRYDWYLMASVVSDVPMQRGPQPYSLIGVDLDDGTLFPEQDGKLTALIDFAQPRKDYPKYRAKQIEALERTRTPYTVLEGEYAIADIRSLYRKAGIFFLASKESFGLSICEVQACGALVFTPSPVWPAGHWLKSDPTSKEPGRLSPNFRVYDDSLSKLIDEINHARESFHPPNVRRTFLEAQPHLYYGDRDALGDFLSRVEDRTIHSRLHEEHVNVGR